MKHLLIEILTMGMITFYLAQKVISIFTAASLANRNAGLEY
jgi:hypothetical protein